GGDSTFTLVARCQRQPPVAITHLVLALEVADSCVGRGSHVTATVVPPVLPEAEVCAGARYKLPESCRLGTGIGKWIVRAFNHWQQRQLQGHVVVFELGYHVM